MLIIKDERRKNRSKIHDYSRNSYYFITICVKNRIHAFGKIKSEKIILNKYGQIAKSLWFEISYHFYFTFLEEFIVMPNHIHGIIRIVGTGHDLPYRNCYKI